MNQKMAVIGGSLLALLMGSFVNSSQAYQGNRQGEYQAQSSNRYSQYQSDDQRRYNSQYYRSRDLPIPMAKTKSPVDLLEESINKVISFLSQPQQINLEQITFFLNQEITPHFDFEYMSRWVAGRYYRTMSAEQKKQFNKTFSELFITTFVQKMSSYQNYPPVVSDFHSRRTKDNEATATAKIFQENGGSIQVDFKFLKTSGGWKVVDVRANGVSALLHYRNYFAKQIRRRDQQHAVFN